MFALLIRRSCLFHPSKETFLSAGEHGRRGRTFALFGPPFQRFQEAKVPPLLLPHFGPPSVCRGRRKEGMMVLARSTRTNFSNNGPLITAAPRPGTEHMRTRTLINYQLKHQPPQIEWTEGNNLEVNHNGRIKLIQLE